MENDNKLTRSFARPLISGAVGSIAAAVFLGESGSINVFNMNVPVWMWIGGTVAVADLAAEPVSQYLLPMLPQSQQMTSIEQTFLPPLSAGLTLFVVNFAAGASDFGNLIPMVALGGISVASGSYLEGMLFEQSSE